MALRRYLAHRPHWKRWAREWIAHQVDRWAHTRIETQRVGWFTEGWLRCQHRRRFGPAPFPPHLFRIGTDPSPADRELASILADETDHPPVTVGRVTVDSIDIGR